MLKTYRGPLYRQGKNIRVRIEIGVDGSGKVASCDVQSSSGSVENDRRLCAAMRRDARFKPATDASGAPIAGVFILRAAFFDGDREEGAPAGYKDPIVSELRIANLSVASSQKPVRFARIIAAQGAVEVWAPEEQEKLSSEDAAAACRGLAALPARRPLMNADGIP